MQVHHKMSGMGMGWKGLPGESEHHGLLLKAEESNLKSFETASANSFLRLIMPSHAICDVTNQNAKMH